MEQRVSVVTLGVADLARARRFYEDGLGWRPAHAEEAIVFFQVGGAVFSLYGRDALGADAGVPAEGSGFRGFALACNVRSSAEVERVLAEAVAAGGRLVKAAETVFWGGYSGYFADPDGFLWEVAFNPFWEMDAEGRIVLPG